MHELAVTENLLNIAVRHATQANAVRVTTLHLVIGQLSSIVDDSIQFYWDMISAGTICEGAQLHFERRPAMLKCLDCDQTYALSGELTDCPTATARILKLWRAKSFIWIVLKWKQNLCSRRTTVRRINPANYHPPEAIRTHDHYRVAVVEKNSERQRSTGGRKPRPPGSTWHLRPQHHGRAGSGKTSTILRTIRALSSSTLGHRSRSGGRGRYGCSDDRCR